MNFIDLKKQYENYKSEIDTAINDVVKDAKFIMGPHVAQFEQELTEFIEIEHAISCSSGTDALLLAMMAYDIQPGDEIITTPFSFIAAAEAVAFLKAKPVFVDIDPRTYNIDPQLIEDAISAKTKGIIIVNIFGQCADYDTIRSIAEKHKLFIIEDAAQSFGAEYKEKKSCSFGNISCTSFFPAKPLGCFGDGGAVFTNNEDLATRIRSLRLHGKGTQKYDHIYIGMNGRLDTIQAAVLSVKLRHFSDEFNARNRVAQYYTDKLSEICITPFVEKHNRSAFAQYVIQVENRDALQLHLKNNEIPTAIHYPKPLHLQPILQSFGYQQGDFPISEKLCSYVLALPMHPFLSTEEQDKVIQAILSFYKGS